MQSWAEDFLELLDGFVLGDGFGCGGGNGSAKGLEDIVEVGMVMPRDWRTLVACNTVRLVCKMDGVVQCVENSCHVSALRYLLIAGM
jgi:hypothetical protein